MADVNIIDKHLDEPRIYITMGDILLWPISDYSDNYLGMDNVQFRLKIPGFFVPKTGSKNEFQKFLKHN